MSSEKSGTSRFRFRVIDLAIGASLVAALVGLLMIDRAADDQSPAKQLQAGLLSETDSATKEIHDDPSSDAAKNAEELPKDEVAKRDQLEDQSPVTTSTVAETISDPKPQPSPKILVVAPTKPGPPATTEIADTASEKPVPSTAEPRLPMYELPGLPVRSSNDETVDRFIQYDVGRLRGRAGNEARLAFNRIGNEAIPALIRGLNQAAQISASCPIVVLQRKLESLLRQANDPKMYELAIAHIGDGVPRSAPYFRRITGYRDSLNRHLPISHPLRKQADIIVQMRGYTEQQLAEAMANPNPQIRLSAARSARSRGYMMATDLLRLLQDTSPNVRKESHLSLVALARNKDHGSTVGKTGDELAATLASWGKWWQFEQTRMARGDFLRNMRSYSNELLRTALQSDQVGERWAATSLVRTKRLPYYEELIQLLKDDDDSVRFEAREALAQSADGVNYGPKDNANEAAIAVAMGKWTKWSNRQKLMPKYAQANVETIRSGFNSTEALERWAAVTTARLKKVDIPTDFIAMLQDEDLDIRQESRHALVQLSNGSDFGPSENANKDEQAYATTQWDTWRVRQELVRRFENASRTVLFSTLESSSLDKRWAAVTLIRRKKMEVPQRLINVLTDPDPDVRQIARLCLVGLAEGEDFGPEENVEAVQQAMAVLRWKKWQRRSVFDKQFASMDLSGVVAEFTSANPLKRWSAVSVARKKSLKVPRALIDRLTDTEDDVRREARIALVGLADQSDFGPSDSATPTQLAAAVKNWLDWWNENYEELAQKRLKLAELLVSKGRRDKAKPRLQSIIDDFPETKAATRARRLIQ